MKRTFVLVGLIALLCFAVATAFGAGGSNGTITGVVKDINTGAALSGVTVSTGRTSATTNSSGVYTLSVAAGSYTLTASLTGYLNTSQITTVSAGVTNTVNWALTLSYGSQSIPAASMNYVILAWNDLGMHCDQDDYSYFCVLPPFNTLHVQVIGRNNTPPPITSGITVSYVFPKKTNSTLHTNFWTYAPQYGWPLADNCGLTGNCLSGNMVVDSNNIGFVATGIPITPYDDDGTWDPYGTATITVKDGAGNTLQTADVVAPVSTEMACSNCHGTTNPQLDILQKHDSHNGTTLVADHTAGTVHLCAECHSSNALGAPGQPGIESLTLAMHNFHKDKMNSTPESQNTIPDCYNCHPGPRTQCLRGIMSRAGKSCHDCHGDMYGMTNGLLGGRQGWLQEPKCGDCHAAKNAENANTLYRNSLLQDGPNNTMNNKLYCEACHNGTHGELTTANAADSTIPMKFQGDNYWIHSCTVCHTNKTGTIHH
jgi:hypothetical protein